MNNLFALMAMIIVIGFLCLSVTLLFHGSHGFNAAYTESGHSSVSRRFKRLAYIKNSSSTCIEDASDVLNNSLVLKSMDLFLKDDETKSFIENVIYNRVSSKESLESFNENSKFAKLIDGYPALSFSMNLPEFDCFSSTLFKKIMIRIKPLNLEFKNEKRNFIRIEQIPDEKVFGVLSVVSQMFLLLRNISQKSQSSMSPFTFSKDQCHFTFRCHFLLRHTHDNKSVASFYFTRLNIATNELSPQFESFQPEFLSLQANSITFDRFDSEIIGNGPHTSSLLSELQWTRMEAHNSENSRINELIDSKLFDATSNLAYEIFNVVFSSTHGDFLFFKEDNREDGHTTGINTNYYEIANNLQQKKGEFLTFVSQHSEFYELQPRSSTVESQFAGVVISVDDDNMTYFKTVDIAYSHFTHHRRHLLLTEASAEVVERLSSADENDMEEFKKKTDLSKAFFEFGDLCNMFRKELKQKSKSDTKLKQSTFTDSILKLISNDKFRKLVYVIVPSATTLAVIGMLVFYFRRRRLIGARDDLSLRTQIDTLTE